MVKALLLGVSLVAAYASAGPVDDGFIDLSVRKRGVMTQPLLLTALAAEARGQTVCRLSFDGQTNVTDGFLLGMMTATPLPRLNHINLDGTNITDLGVHSLLNSQGTAVQSTAPLGNYNGQPTLTLNLSATGTQVDKLSFHRKTVASMLLASVSRGTSHIPLGGYVGETGLSFQSVKGQKRVAVTK
jgi:hypothetical protein